MKEIITELAKLTEKRNVEIDFKVSIRLSKDNAEISKEKAATINDAVNSFMDKAKGLVDYMCSSDSRKQEAANAALEKMIIQENMSLHPNSTKQA